jgi:hypothetical protein
MGILIIFIYGLKLKVKRLETELTLHEIVETLQLGIPEGC